MSSLPGLHLILYYLTLPRPNLSGWVVAGVWLVHQSSDTMAFPNFSIQGSVRDLGVILEQEKPIKRVFIINPLSAKSIGVKVKFGVKFKFRVKVVVNVCVWGCIWLCQMSLLIALMAPLAD